jgi:hypothetical protein
MRPVFATAVVWTAITTGAAQLRSQSVELRLEPSAARLHTCGELEVNLRLVGTVDGLAGFQVFLRFPGASLEAVLYEPGDIQRTVVVAAPPPLGSGFAPCDVGSADPWGDGMGEDVVGVVASVYDAAGGAPLVAGEVALGRIVFRPRPGAVPASRLELALNDEPCRSLVDQSTRFFGTQGQSLDVRLSEPFAVELVDGLQVLDLACGVFAERTVTLSWRLAPHGTAQSLLVRRDGELLATLDGTALGFVDASPPGTARATYEVISLLSAGFEGCVARCEAVLDPTVLFRRGDSNRDDAVNITDAVALLRHLFQGSSLSCQDAGDFDDNGTLELTDAIFGLNYLFQAGRPIPAPFPDPGLDPTADALGCEA